MGTWQLLPDHLVVVEPPLIEVAQGRDVVGVRWESRTGDVDAVGFAGHDDDPLAARVAHGVAPALRAGPFHRSVRSICLMNHAMNRLHRHGDTRSFLLWALCDLVHMLGDCNDERVSSPQASSEPSERGRQGLVGWEAETGGCCPPFGVSV